ncbi:MAG: hypothetical protein DIU78_014975 [Pseudomonadota bacterium]
MTIRSALWALRIAVAAAAFAAFATETTEATAQTRATAAVRPNVALGPIRGKRAKTVRGWVRNALKRNFVVTDAAEVVPAEGTDDAFAKSASMLGVQYVLLGEVEGANLTLTVRDAETGAVVDTIELKTKNVYRLKRSISTSLSKDLGNVITAAQAARAAKAKEEEEARARAAAKAAEEEESEEETSEDESEEDESSEEESAEEETTETEEETDAGSGSVSPRLVLAGGLEGIRRDFTYSDQIADVREGAGFPRLADYHLPLQPGGFVRLEVYPAAFFSDGFVSNIGLVAGLHQGIGTKSTYASGTVREELSNVTQHWFLGARVRFPFDDLETGFGFTYGKHKFVLEGDEMAPRVPDVEYSYVRIGGDLQKTFGKGFVGGRLGVRLLSGTGDLESATWFPGATGTALELGLFGGYRLFESMDIVAGIDFVRYGFDFNAIPDTNMKVAGGAVDQFIIGTLGVRYLMGGGASQQTSDAAQEETAEAEKAQEEEAQEEEAADEEEEEEEES